MWRLGNARNMHPAEADLILRTLAVEVRTYEHVVELLSLLPTSKGGLMPLSFGLFHQAESVRDSTVELLNTLRGYQVCHTELVSLSLTTSRLGHCSCGC